MTEEQIANRYVRGWISLEEYRKALVAFYDREDAKDRKERPDLYTDWKRNERF